MSKKCEICGCKDNVAKVVTIIADEKRTIFLCENCLDKNLPQEQMSKYFQTAQEFSDQLLEEWSQIKCDDCGISWAQYTETTQFFCEKCYDSFSELIQEFIGDIQGFTKNRQDLLENDDDKEVHLSILKLKLKEAIAQENFEIAARLRDQISFYE